MIALKKIVSVNRILHDSVFNSHVMVYIFVEHLLVEPTWVEDDVYANVLHLVTLIKLLVLNRGSGFSDRNSVCITAWRYTAALKLVFAGTLLFVVHWHVQDQPHFALRFKLIYDQWKGRE